MTRRPPPRFATPDFPPRFKLVSPDGDDWLGPFDRDAIYHEPDRAIVFYEDGSLPLRIGVLRQEGDILHLFPEGTCRVVAAD